MDENLDKLKACIEKMSELIDDIQKDLDESKIKYSTH